jgi:hypothetical protein
MANSGSLSCVVLSHNAVRRIRSIGRSTFRDCRLSNVKDQPAVEILVPSRKQYSGFRYDIGYSAMVRRIYHVSIEAIELSEEQLPQANGSDSHVRAESSGLPRSQPTWTQTRSLKSTTLSGNSR